MARQSRQLSMEASKPSRKETACERRSSPRCASSDITLSTPATTICLPLFQRISARLRGSCYIAATGPAFHLEHQPRQKRRIVRPNNAGSKSPELSAALRDARTRWNGTQLVDDSHGSDCEMSNIRGRSESWQSVCLSSARLRQARLYRLEQLGVPFLRVNVTFAERSGPVNH